MKMKMMMWILSAICIVSVTGCDGDPLDNDNNDGSSTLWQMPEEWLGVWEYYENSEDSGEVPQNRKVVVLSGRNKYFVYDDHL